MNRQYIYTTSFVLLVFLLVKDGMFGQVNRLTKVKKQTIQHQYPTEEGYIPDKSLDKKENYYWTVYSDRAANMSYQDPYAKSPLKELDFMQACYVIDEKNDFLELVLYDSALFPPKKCLSTTIFKKFTQFKFEDIKEVEYLGWVHKSKLILSNKAWVSNQNMKPVRYILDIGNASVLLDRELLIKGDTVVTYKDPDLTRPQIPEEISPKVKDIVYVYKQSLDEKKVLVGYKPNFTPENPKSIYGWVNKELVLPIGQQQILVPDLEKDSLGHFTRTQELFFDTEEKARKYRLGFLSDSIVAKEKYVVDLEETVKPFYFNNNLQSETETPSEQELYSTYLPFEVWDHSPNKVINMNGDFVFFNEFENFKKKSKHLNIVILVEDNYEMQTELLHLTNSLQKLYGILNKDELKGYKATLGAISYDQQNIKSVFDLGGTLSGWLDFVKGIAENNTQNAMANSIVGNGFEMALEKAIELLKPKSDETNVLIVVGASASTYNKAIYKNLTNKLSEVSPRLLFYQLLNKSNGEFVNFNFKAKDLLYSVGRRFVDTRLKFIVDSKLYKIDFKFTIIDEIQNIFMFNPEACIYQGGLAFPRINSKLHPNTFDQLFEKLILEIVADNRAVEASLQEYFDGVGKERSKIHPIFLNHLTKRGLIKEGITELSSTTQKDNYQMLFSAVEDSSSLVFDHYYLLSSDEYEHYINYLKNLIPEPHKKVTRKFRRKLYKNCKKDCKKLNRIFSQKIKMRKVRLSSMMFMETGIAVNNSLYKEITVKHIKNKCKMSHSRLQDRLDKISANIAKLERFPIDNPEKVYTVQDVKYIYLPVEFFL